MVHPSMQMLLMMGLCEGQGGSGGGGGDDCRPRQSKKTNLVFWTTKSVANDKICLPDNKVCRGRQSLSLTTMLVVSDEPK